MKTSSFILILSLSLFATGVVYAGNSSVLANYPAPSGSYNKMVLQKPVESAAVIDSSFCQNPNNAGMLYMEMCANGSAKPIPYPETCFNRFYSWSDNNPSSAETVPMANYTACPAGYSFPPNANPIQDAFITYYDAVNNLWYHVQSTVCCNTSSIVHP